MQTAIDNKTIAAQLRALADEFEAFEANDSQPPKLGIVGTGKLAVSTLLDGVLLSIDQLGTLQKLYDRLATAELAAQSKNQYMKLLNRLYECEQAAQAAIPHVGSGPNGIEIEIMLRNGIPQNAINTVTLAARDYGRDLRGEVDPPIAPEPERKPIVARCMSCNNPFTAPPRKGSVCPRCGSFQF